ncbi:MAG: N-acetylmuramoyl-L-alanine amidase [Magnetococcus sp. THC-1_WYH]
MKRRSLLQALAVSAGGIMFPFSFSFSEEMSMIRFSSIETMADGLRVGFTITGDIVTRGFLLERPHRAVLDFTGAPMFLRRELTEFHDPLVKKVRFGLQTAINGRLVFDLLQRVRIETTDMAIGPGKREWTVWLKRQDSDAVSTTASSVPEPVPATQEQGMPGRDQEPSPLPPNTSPEATAHSTTVAQKEPLSSSGGEETSGEKNLLAPTNNQPSVATPGTEKKKSSESDPENRSGGYVANQGKTILTVTSLRQEGETVEITFAAEGVIRHRAYTLESPSRGVIDLFETSIANSTELTRVRNDLIRRVRIGHPHARGTRIVFDYQGAVRLEANLVSAANGDKNQFLLRLNRANQIQDHKAPEFSQAQTMPSSGSESISEPPVNQVSPAIPTGETNQVSPAIPTGETRFTDAPSLTASPAQPFETSPITPASPVIDPADLAQNARRSMESAFPVPSDQGPDDNTESVMLAPAGPSKAPATPQSTTPTPAIPRSFRSFLEPPAPGKQSLPFRTRRAYEAFMDPTETIIMVDPGHGGIDPGAVGREGTLEKDITLAVARRLFQKLNGYQNCKVVLTRNEDRFLTLKQRVALARRARADLFLSLHADAYRDPAVHGASVFCLTDGVQYDLDEKDRLLAQRENAASDIQPVNETVEHQDSLMELLQMDAIKKLALADSVQFGRKLIQSLRNRPGIGVHYPRVKRVNFLVLKNPGIPSSLVEMGFLSNPRDERRMVNAGYQEMMAEGLASGICKFFRLAPTDKA